MPKRSEFRLLTSTACGLYAGCEERKMSLAEKLYLVMVVSMFVSFGVLLATLSWLDSREEKAAQWNDRKKTMAVQRNKNVSQPMGHSPAASH
jgi:high-affinity Fe2+/Pb2+ permease